MGLYFSRITVIERRTEQALEVSSEIASTSQTVDTVSLVSPLTEIAATRFIIDDAYPDQVPIIRIYRNDSDTGAFLMPHDFIDYVKIIISDDAGGGLKIAGVPAVHSNFRRIKGLGFIFGREYEGERVQQPIYAPPAPANLV